MTIAFHDIDPYATLLVPKDASPIEIKKSYKKLCLKHHPDKIQQLNQQQETDVFPKIQFAYSILSDLVKRQRYDLTGSLGSSDDDSSFNWKEYFDSTSDKITIEMIEEDRNKYQGSIEEKDDILSNFLYYEGDFLKLFELVPHLEFTEIEEDRVFKIIESEEKHLDTHTEKSWEKYKKSRKTKVKQMLKRLAKEAKEAAELEKKITGKRGVKKESDLAALIKGRQANRMDTLISLLENKYVKGKKRKEMSDEEFDKIQSGLKKRK